MKSVYEWVKRAILGLPGWLRRALKTKGGKYLAGIAVAQLARRVPMLAGVDPSTLLDILNALLDTSTVVQIGALGLTTPSMVEELRAAGMPVHVVGEFTDAPSLQRVIIASQPCQVKEWHIDTQMRLVAVLTDGREAILPPGAQTEAQSILFQQLLAQVRR